MPRRHTGVLDTCAYIDLAHIDPLELPEIPEITAVTLAELHQGVAMAKEATSRAARAEKLAAAVADFDPLPFDANAASRYGTLVALTLTHGRDPKPRRLDLMIAAIASTQGMALFTRNANDFSGLEPALTVIAV
jgi:predicted nucleic acid-binding protein